MRDQQGGRYDDRLDRKLFSRTWEGKQWKLIVTVFSYKGMRPKLEITREKMGLKYKRRPFAKLGRLSKEEVAGILPFVQEALHHMK